MWFHKCTQIKDFLIIDYHCFSFIIIDISSVYVYACCTHSLFRTRHNISNYANSFAYMLMRNSLIVSAESLLISGSICHNFRVFERNLWSLHAYHALLER